MPRGDVYTVTGMLLRDGRRTILRIDDGGEWELDIHPRDLKLLGRRVTVEGIRDGFDLLAVRRINVA